jgi:hypothetical protein
MQVAKEGRFAPRKWQCFENGGVLCGAFVDIGGLAFHVNMRKPMGWQCLVFKERKHLR